MSIGVLEEIVAGRMTGMPRLNVQQFERLMDSGVLDPEVHYELLDGYVVLKNRAPTGESPMNIGVRHSYVTDALSGKLHRELEGTGFSLRTQSPLSINEFSQPEPDLAIIRGRGVDYSPLLPGSNSVVLLIEVSDSSLEADRGKKLEQYARERIPTYWIVNLRENQIEIYTAPVFGKQNYAQCQIFLEHQMVEISIPGREPFTLSVRTILDGTL